MPRYIDRDIALSHPFANGQYDKENANEHFIIGYEGYKEWLEQLPTVEAEPVRHGHWVHNKWSNMRHDYNCSLCGCRISGVDPFSLSATAYYYCPECGAKMDEVVDDE